MSPGWVVGDDKVVVSMRQIFILLAERLPRLPHCPTARWHSYSFTLSMTNLTSILNTSSHYMLVVIKGFIYTKDIARNVCTALPTSVPLLIALLLLPRIPPQLPRYTVNPVLTPPTLRHDIGKWISTSTNGHVISRAKLHSLTAIKRGPGRGACIIWHTDS